MRSFALLALFFAAPAFADWKPAPAPLMTRWGKAVTPGQRLAGVPAPAARPQGVAEPQRPVGLRDHREGRRSSRTSGTARSWCRSPPRRPCPASASTRPRTNTSGITGRFWCPPSWKGQRLLLHFEAVDFEATVFVNGKELGTHRGMSDPFSFDMTDALKDGRGELVVRVWDPTDDGSAAARQAGQEARRHLVHAGQRHLADGLAGAGAGDAHHERPVHPGHGQGRGRVSSSRRRRSRRRRSIGSRSTDARLADRATEQGIPVSRCRSRSGRPETLDPGRPAPLLRSRSRLVTRHAKAPCRTRSTSYFAMRKVSAGKDEHGRHAAHAQQQAALPGRAARPGVVAGRAAHPAVRRGDGLRPRRCSSSSA